MASRAQSRSPVVELPSALWVNTEVDYSAGLWDSAPSSVRGSFRAEETEESALCCSLSVSEDGLSEYSTDHYGSESGSRRSGRGGSAAASPGTTTTSRSGSARNNRSIPSSVYLGTSVAGGGLTPSEPSSSGFRPSEIQTSAQASRAVAEAGSVSPKRRSQGRGAGNVPRRQSGPGAAGRGDASRGSWLGRPAANPPRGQVGFQSCLRPGIGSVRTILEEDEEGWEESEEEEKAPSPLPKIERIRSQISAKEVEKGLDNGLDVVRTGSGGSQGAGSSLKLNVRGSSQAGALSHGRRPAQDHPSCLCPGAMDTATEASSVVDSPPGSPDRLTVSGYFCGLPGTGYGRRRRSCGLCGRQVSRRAPQCSMCRLIVYCDRRCLDQHQTVHFRTCPGASAQRLREAASALRAAEADQDEEEAPKRKTKDTDTQRPRKEKGEKGEREEGDLPQKEKVTEAPAAARGLAEALDAAAAGPGEAPGAGLGPAATGPTDDAPAAPSQQSPLSSRQDAGKAPVQKSLTSAAIGSARGGDGGLSVAEGVKRSTTHVPSTSRQTLKEAKAATANQLLLEAK